MEDKKLMEECETLFRLAHSRQPYSTILDVMQKKVKDIFNFGMDKGYQQSKENKHGECRL